MLNPFRSIFKKTTNNTKALKSVYILGFFFSLHLSFKAYIDSTFISGFIDERFVGFLFTAGAVLTILLLIGMTKLLNKFGNFKVIAFLTILNFFALLGMAFFQLTPLVILSFVIHWILMHSIVFNIDVFLEEFADHKHMGRIRGVFLTITDLAWVFSPLMAGLLLDNGNYFVIYGIAAIITTPCLYIIFKKLRNVKEPEYDTTPFFTTVKNLAKNENIKDIYLARFLLAFFTTWMIIYTPVYLYNHIGLSWTQMGIIFTISQLPFIFLEYPLGRLADIKYGEKGMLIGGFVIIAITTASISFISTQSIAVWALVLFMTRVGASTIKVMAESYFFKQITQRDINIMSFFRNTAPMAYIVSPVIATLILLIAPYKYLFLILGIIMLIGIKYSLAIVNTK